MMTVKNTMKPACALSNLSGTVVVISGSLSHAKLAWIRRLIRLTLISLRSKRIIAAHSVILPPCHRPYNFSSNSRTLSLSPSNCSKKRSRSWRVSCLASQPISPSTPRPVRTLKRPCLFSKQLMSARSRCFKSSTQDSRPPTIRGSCKSTMRAAFTSGRTAPPTSWGNPS